MAKEPTIREATGVAIPVAVPGKTHDKAVRVMLAMGKAVTECTEKGITDPNKVRAAMLKARDEVK